MSRSMIRQLTLACWTLAAVLNADASLVQMRREEHGFALFSGIACGIAIFAGIMELVSTLRKKRLARAINELWREYEEMYAEEMQEIVKILARVAPNVEIPPSLKNFLSSRAFDKKTSRHIVENV